MNLFDEIKKATEQWRLACLKTDAVLEKLLGSRVKFSELKVGDYFKDEGVTYEKKSDRTAWGPRRSALGTGVYDFEPDDEVEPL
jgi:hypothetical protein